MFDLYESKRKHWLWPWILPWALHSVACVFLPLLMVGNIGSHFWPEGLTASSLELRNRALRNQKLLEYAVLWATGFLMGGLARYMHPKTAKLAASVWILPVCWLAMALCFDLVAFPSDWTGTISEYFINLIKRVA